jgi:hypothetical protein
MRFALGLIVGIVLTIGSAYVADALHSAPGPDQKEAPRMVNWGVVNDNLKGLSTSVQDGWSRLTGHARQA